MDAFKVLELAEDVMKPLKKLNQDEQEIIDEYIGEFIGFDEAHKKLEELKCKQGR